MDKNFSPKGFGSAAIHAGHEQDPLYAHQTPIYASSTYVYDTAEQGMRRFSGEEPGYIYSRWGNPTITEAEQKNCSTGKLWPEYGSKRHPPCIGHGGYFHLIAFHAESRR